MMGGGMDLMIWALAGLGALLLGGLALRLILAPEAEQEKSAARRMKQLAGPSDHATAEAMVLKQAPQTGRSLPLIGNPMLLVRRAQLQGKEPVLLLATFLLGITLGGLMAVKLGAAGMVLGMAAAIYAVMAYLKAQAAKRIDALTRQLPDALDLMMRGLRVGHPVSATVANVGRTMADPIGAEFRILAEQVAHGDYLTEAFSDMADRCGQEDVEYLAVAINIQHGTGGNLADMLGTLSSVVRARIIMRRRVRAISSEGRMSAYLLSALPVLMYVATSFTAPNYYGEVADDPLFMPMAMTIIALVVANFLALRKLVTFQY